MSPQVPKLLESNLADIDHIAALTDRRFRAGTIRYGRAQWLDESAQVLVQSEQPQHLPRDLGLDIRPSVLLLPVFVVLVRCDFLCVQMRNFEDVEGNASLVSSTGPLWIELARLFIFVYVYRLVKVVEIVLLPPIFRVFELSEGILRDELARAEVSEEGLVVVGSRSLSLAWIVVSLLFAQLFELVERALLALTQMPYVSRRPLYHGVNITAARPGSVARYRRTYLERVNPLQLTAVDFRVLGGAHGWQRYPGRTNVCQGDGS